MVISCLLFHFFALNNTKTLQLMLKFSLQRNYMVSCTCIMYQNKTVIKAQKTTLLWKHFFKERLDGLHNRVKAYSRVVWLKPVVYIVPYSDCINCICNKYRIVYTDMFPYWNILVFLFQPYSHNFCR